MSTETGAPSAEVSAPSATSPARPDGVDIVVKGVGVAPNKENGVDKSLAVTEPAVVNGSENKQRLPESTPTTEGKPAASSTDAEKDSQTKTNAATTSAAGEASIIAAPATPASSGKSKARRKSAGVPEHKSKKLNKKASKIKMSHADAKPGDYYYIRLKGYPLWPGIVCDESMLPQSLISTRPVTAAKPDGTYRAEYEDGGKKIHDRTFPVMYLSTNEFGWIPNYDLIDIDLEEVGKVDPTTKMRRDLFLAHQLAAEKHDLAYYKQVLLDFQAQREAEAEAKAAAKAAKEALKSSGKNKKKSKAGKDVEGETEDVEMPDAEGELDVDGDTSEKKPKSSKKRKALADPEEPNTPQVSTSAKKLKFKPLNTSTPKTANGATPKSVVKKDSSAKTPKSKSKKATNGTTEKVALTPKEPELTPEEKRVKKEKEILFLRHKLQKGLLTRDQQPKEEEMKQMSEFISKLEGYADLEVSIIRATKINKVLKAILKLSEIPKETEFQFKDRSKSLLEKWNKILESAEQPAVLATPGPGEVAASSKITNGDSIAPKAEENDEKDGSSENNTEPAALGSEDTTIPDTTKKELDLKAGAIEDSVVPPAPEPVSV